MLIDLQKYDLMSLVRGEMPNYSLFTCLNDYGYYDDCRGEWHWHELILERLDKKELYELYLLCKNSWEDDYDFE